MNKDNSDSISIGICLGVAFGLIFNNLTLGILLGVAIGAAGIFDSKRKAKKKGPKTDHKKMN